MALQQHPTINPSQQLDAMANLIATNLGSSPGNGSPMRRCFWPLLQFAVHIVFDFSAHDF